jgi:hypothetical protein
MENIKNIKTEILITILFIIIYLLLSNAKSIKPNPFMFELMLTSGIMITLIAGIIFNWRIPIFIAIIGGLINYFFIAENIDKLLVIIPNIIVGVMAGLLKCKLPSPIVALLIIPGNIIKYSLFNYFNTIEIFLFNKIDFWFAFSYECFINYITIIIIISIYRIIILDKEKLCK